MSPSGIGATAANSAINVDTRASGRHGVRVVGSLAAEIEDRRLRREQRRRYAVLLLRRNHTQSAIARELGVSRQLVHRWVKAWLEEKRVKESPRGRRPRLSLDQRLSVGRAIQNRLRRDQYSGTLSEVITIVQEHCGVRFHPEHLRKIALREGWI
ncbi:MAG: helix-turn-helix domain-containing protein [Candidatus Limnocylindria bacterium]